MFSIEGKIDLGLPRHFENQDFSDRNLFFLLLVGRQVIS
jgi:hypothetical protein